MCCYLLGVAQLSSKVFLCFPKFLFQQQLFFLCAIDSSQTNLNFSSDKKIMKYAIIQHINYKCISDT